MITFIAGVLFASIILIPIAIIRGYVLSILWGWFLVPLGVVEISVPHAIGFLLLIGLVTPNPNEKKEGKPLEKFLSTILSPLIAWLFGAIIHYYI